MASTFKRAVAYNPIVESLVRRLHGAKPRILTYHRFPTRARENFTRQCEHLRKHYHPVALDQLVTALRQGSPLPPRSVVVTIDDGYLDVYEVAAPILRRYGIPATMYAVSGFLDRDLWLWWDRLTHAFLESPLDRVELPLPDREPFTADLGSPAQRRALAEKISVYIVRSDNSQVEALCAEITRALKVNVPTQPEPAFAPMSWDQARELTANGFTIGSHTVHHWIVGTLPSTEAKRTEIQKSRERIEQMLNQPVRHFCFPNGGIGDFSHVDLNLIREAGYSSAVTTLMGLIQPQCDYFQLPRLNVGAEMDLATYRMKVAGLFEHRSGANITLRRTL